VIVQVAALRSVTAVTLIVDPETLTVPQVETV
jgi:hypothetical protein